LSAAVLGGLVCLIGWSWPVGAHPHVWINDVTTFLFKDRQLVGIRQHWEFDEIFSSFVIKQHDKNGDGRFDKAENASVQKEAFSNLHKYGYFTHVRVDDQKVPLDRVEGFQATIKKDIMVYDFTLRLPKPVDVTKRHFQVGVFDPEYYVEVDLDENDPVHFSGLPSGACTFDIREDTKHPIYYGMVDPPVIYLNCATS
jgi:nickel/cobalt exporter